jgi:hypothetical protein
MQQPRKPKRRAKAIQVGEVSLVPAGDNPEAHVVLAKIRTPLSKDEPSPESEPRSFAALMERLRLSAVESAISERAYALSQAIFETLYSDVTDKEARILANVAQFKDTMDRDVGELLAGRLAKLTKQEDLPTVGEIHAAITEVLTSTDDHGRNDMSRTTDQLPKEPQEQITKIEKERDDALARVIELEKENAQLRSAPAAPTPEDLYKGIPEATVKILKEKDAENERLAKTVSDLVEKQRRSELAGRASEFSKMAVAQDKLTELFVKADKAGLLDDLVAILRPLHEQAKKARTFEELGSNGPVGGDAYRKIEARAEELRKAQPTLTRERAIARALEESPELYDEYVEQTNAA